MTNHILNYQNSLFSNIAADAHYIHINPFASLLFNDKWKTFPETFPASFQNKLKHPHTVTSIKKDLLKWFKTLSSKQKTAAIEIKDKYFIDSFFKYDSKKYQNKLINPLKNLSILDLSANEKRKKEFCTIKKHLYICWMDEPVLYMKFQEDRQSQKLLIEWLDQVSDNKIFEYSHRQDQLIIKRFSDNPEQNPLWYSSNSFHSLDEILVNEIQKSITKSYYHRDSLQNSKVDQLKAFLKKKKIVNQQQLNIQTSIVNFLEMTQAEIQTIKNDIKQYQKAYNEYVRLSCLESMESLHEKQKNNAKNKKNKKRAKKKASHSPHQDKQIEQDQTQSQSCRKKTRSSIQMEISEFCQLKVQSPEDQCLEPEPEPEKKSQLPTTEFEIVESIQQIIISDQIKEEQEHINQNLLADDSISEFSERQMKKSKKASKNLVTNVERCSSPGVRRHTIDEKCREAASYGQSSDDRLTIAVTEECTTKAQQFQPLNFIGSQNGQSHTCCKKKRRRKGQNNMHKAIDQMTKRSSSGLINKQLTSFIDSLSMQTNNLYESKVICFQRVRYFIKNIFCETEAVLFGSNAVGLSLPTSDIDIMLYNMPCTSKQQINEILAQIAIEINAMGWIVSCSTYLSAKVPIVKLQIDPLIGFLETKRRCDSQQYYDPMMMQCLNIKDRKKSRNIKVDLTICMEKGIASSPSTELMRNWLGENPLLQRVIIALKYILAEKGYNENFKGGVGSYCLFVMIAAYFKEFKDKLAQDQGQIFLDILKFYGQEFENKLNSITLRQTGSCFISFQESLAISSISEEIVISNPLRIIDPLTSRLMSSSCYQYNNIKMEFRRIRNEVLSVFKNIEHEISNQYTSSAELTKILATQKSVDKWINKYQSRTRFSIKKIIDRNM